MNNASKLYDDLRDGNIIYILESLIDSYNDRDVDVLLATGTGGSWEIPPNELIQVVSGYYTKSERADILGYLDRHIKDYEALRDSIDTTDNMQTMFDTCAKRTKLVKDIVEICFDINQSGKLFAPNQYGKLSAPDRVISVDDRIVLSNACYILATLAFGG